MGFDFPGMTYRFKKGGSVKRYSDGGFVNMKEQFRDGMTERNGYFKEGGSVGQKTPFGFDKPIGIYTQFLDGSVVQSRVPMLAPRPQIFNLRI